MFESDFRKFIGAFGGEVLPEASHGRSADYLFRQYNVVAELKSLKPLIDQREDASRRLRRVIEQRLAAHQHPPQAAEIHEDRFRLLSYEQEGRDDILLRGTKSNGESFTLAFSEIQGDLQKPLLSQIENLVKDANQQIRETKERLSIPSADGLVLIFNESNFLHTSPEHFAELAGVVIQKQKSGAERRFPHIQGMVYFSFDTVTTQDGQAGKEMSFWMPAQVQGESAERIKRFQEALKKGWYRHIETTTGRSVVSHLRDMRWPGASVGS